MTSPENSEEEELDEEFQWVLNPQPPGHVFNNMMTWMNDSEGGHFRENDYNIWSNNYEKHWFYAIQEIDTEKYIATISVAQSTLRDETQLFTIAFCNCLPEFRSMEFGTTLLNKARQIYNNQNCSLFAMTPVWEGYQEQYGFAFQQSLSIAVVLGKDLKLPDNLQLNGVKIDDVADQNIQKVLEYDAIISEMKREKVMENWLSGVNAKVALDMETQNCVGFGAIREISKNRLNISPLYADSPEIAEQILNSLLKSFDFTSFSFISAIYPAENSKVSELLKKFSKEDIIVNRDYGQCLFTQKVIKYDAEKIFGIRNTAHGYI